MIKGLYTSTTNSALYIDVHKVHHISERTGRIKMKATIYYRSNNEICHWLTPHGAKNLSLIYDVVKHWKRYAK